MPSYPYPKLELKYCERCGGLWLRPQGADAIYCLHCAREIRELPPVRNNETPSGTMQAVYADVIALAIAPLALADSLTGAFA